MTEILNKIMACLTPFKIDILVGKENEIRSILAFFEADTVGFPTVVLKIQYSPVNDDDIVFNLQCDYPILGKDGVWIKEDDIDIVTAVQNYLTNAEKFIRRYEYEKEE